VTALTTRAGNTQDDQQTTQLLVEPHYYVEDHEDGTLRANGDGGHPRIDKQPLLVAEPYTFDWQAGGHGDETWRGKSRQWIDDKPGTTRSLSTTKTLAVHVPDEPTAFHLSQDPISGEGFTPAMGKGTSNHGMATIGVSQTAGVRRLTPVECERLQGLPDGWTDVFASVADSRRYSGLGDAVTANVAEWIGRRLYAADA